MLCVDETGRGKCLEDSETALPGFAPDGGGGEGWDDYEWYECPECKAKLFYHAQDAIEFLKGE